MIYREVRRLRAATSNHLVLDRNACWYARFHYRTLRRNGAPEWAARHAVYDLLLHGSWGEVRPVPGAAS